MLLDLSWLLSLFILRLML